ncbi:MAG: DUF3187 family protein [Spirochaetales bacterium]|nr:DUF3187 family protein [Spirochaetales bacterium]
MGYGERDKECERGAGSIFSFRFLGGVGLFLALLFPLHSQTEDYSLTGPLYGKNYYLPHLPVYSFPGFSPRSGQAGDSYISTAYTTLNEFVAYDTATAALDYESSILDLSYSYRWADDLIFGVEGRLIAYYGGFADSIIENFHSFFGFPNAGREYFDQNDLYIFMDNADGTDLTLESAVLALGDTDLSAVWTFYEEGLFHLALAGALKVPTGSLDSCTGSDWVDAGVQFLGEWTFRSRWSLHFQQGFVIPGDWLGSVLFDWDSYSESPVSQTFLALEFAPRSDWRLISQFRINTSPVSSDLTRTYTLWGDVSFFTLPQTALQIGVKKGFGDWTLQAYFEEDPLTYEGADILVSLRVNRAL